MSHGSYIDQNRVGSNYVVVTILCFHKLLRLVSKDFPNYLFLQLSK
uniref:Uncharacterized protein n=1 Tax=Arundo donax TaxID=35708 RepID=A0A0A9EBX0_ARUDO